MPRDPIRAQLADYMWLYLYLALLVFVALVSVGWTWWVVQRSAARQREEQDRITRQSLGRLRSLANRVAADVDEFTARVDEISAALRAPEGKRAEAVLNAVSKLIEANRTMRVQLDSAEERLHAQARQIESQAHEARTDALTQVANRRAFDDELRQAIADFQRDGRPISLLLLDVDRFKTFNDEHGHQAGDEVLRQVARVLRHCTSETDLVARYGGEEFAVIFRGTPLLAVRQAADRICSTVAATTMRLSGRELHVTVSAGLAELLSNEQEHELVDRVDRALYDSKNAGRNCIHWSDGHNNHLLKLEATRKILQAAPDDVADLLGEEWQCDSDPSPDSPYRDALSLVAPRAAFLDDLIRRLAHFRRDRAPFSLLLIQVDRFSQVVESHGHEAAGVVLRVAAQLIKANLRDMDHVTRLATDTFALLLPGTNLTGAVHAGERLRNGTAHCRLPRRAGIATVTLTIGIVEAEVEDDMRRLLQRARNSLQVAIDRGRNQCFALDPGGAADKELAAGAV